MLRSATESGYPPEDSLPRAQQMDKIPPETNKHNERMSEPTPEAAKKKRKLDRLLANPQVGGGGTGGCHRSVIPQEPCWHLNGKEEGGDVKKDGTKGGTKNVEMTLEPAIIPLESDKPSAIPDATRSIIDNCALSDLVEKSAVCRFCHGELKLSFQETVGIATLPRITCSSDDCCDVSGGKLPGANFQKGKTKAKLTEFAINVQFVMSLMACGDGGTEAARILAFLNLPNSTTMGTCTFAKIEKEMDPIIVEVAEQLLHEQLLREVKDATKGDDNFNYEEWLEAINDDTKTYPTEKFPRLAVTMDGAWNQRSSGRTYNSPSGFAILVGTQTWMPIAFSLRSTFCRVCSRQNGNKGLSEHKCEVNHEGTAGAMESAALLTTTHHLYDKCKIVLQCIVTDDDSTMKARLKWSNEDYERVHKAIPLVPITKGPRKGELHERPDNGLLRYPIPEPKFLADPAHRKKTFRNQLCALKPKKAVKENLLHEGDILRLTRNFACMSRQLQSLPKSQWTGAARAALEHHFDNHAFCGDFCKRKKELASGIQNNKKIYRCMEKDKDLYCELKEVLERFISMEKLEEIGHGHHTNVNESFHNQAAWVAPKNKVYSGSVSLRARLSIALGIKIVGYDKFFQKVFKRMDILLEPCLWHCLKWTTEWRRAHKARSEKEECKQKRQLKTNAKIKAHVEKMKEARKANDVYESGIGMEVVNPITPGSEAKKRKTENKPCKCGSWKHKRINHKDCILNPKNIAKRKKEIATSTKNKLGTDEEEQDALDTLDINDNSGVMHEMCRELREMDEQGD